jgi:non-heme chloroperoxidase
MNPKSVAIGSRHPEKVAGLVYLDAAYEYAFYNPDKGDVSLDSIAVRKELGDFVEHEGLDAKTLSQLLEQLPRLQKELEAQQAKLANLPEPPSDPNPEFVPEEAILLGQQEYTKILCPVLAIYADPHDLGPMPEYNAAQRAAMTSLMAEHTATHKSEFEAGVPSAKVVAIPNASHDVYNSNEEEVVKDIQQFTASLPGPE